MFVQFQLGEFMRNHWLILIVGLSSMTGCELVRDQTSPSRVSIRGVPATIESMPSSQVFEARNQLVKQLVRDAGLGDQEPPIGSPQWAVVFRAGVYEVSRQCDMYLDALFRFGREQRAAQQGLSAAAGATGAILGLANAAASAIAITAASFGLAGNLFDAGVNSILFSMEPSALRNVVLQGRQAYLEGVDQQKIVSRPDMLIYLQGYLTQCSPAAIEANVNNAANGSRYAVTVGTDQERRAAARLAAPAVTLIDRSKVVVAGPVQEPTPLPASVRPVGWRDGDRPNITRTDVERIQVALGVELVNGTLDPLTRLAIQEFQRGASQRFGVDAWPDTSGSLSSNTWRTLRALDAPRPDSPLRGPFERALLGNQQGRPAFTTIDPAQISAARGILIRTGIDPNRMDQASSADQPDRERATVLRESIQAARRRQDVQPPPAVGDPRALDSALFGFIRRTPPPQ